MARAAVRAARWWPTRPRTPHLNARDTTLVYVSRAPQADIAHYRARMGWKIAWYTISDDFDTDFGVDEWHGTNVFLRDGDHVLRTYFVDNRGDEALGSVWSYLDITPLGRQEEWEDSPDGYPQTAPYTWWRLHDEYGTEPGMWEQTVDTALPLLEEAARRSAGDAT